MSGERKRRAIYLRVDEVRLLDHWCESLRASFQRPVYLVGSVLKGPGWRDIDVRIPLTDKAMRRLPMHHLDLNMLLSRWGQHMTGLPIDCQVQSATEFENADGPVNPRGYPILRWKAPTTHPSPDPGGQPHG